jgi:hypothetical protein
MRHYIHKVVTANKYIQDIVEQGKIKEYQNSVGNTLPFGISLLTISSIAQWANLPVDNTFIWWIVYFSILVMFYQARTKHFDKEDILNIRGIYIYLLWNIICIVRGTFVAENYWEWKNLFGTSMVLLLPLSIYAFTNRFVVQKTIYIYLKYALPGFFFFYFTFTAGDAIGRYLVPISFLVLFLPILDTKWRIIVLSFTAFVIFGDATARSNVIKFGVPVSLSLLFFLKKKTNTIIFEAIRLLFILLPMVLFVLGFTGLFNVFKMDDYISGDYHSKAISNGEEESLTSDTRTFLYEEVILSAIKYDYILFGRTPARGNESPYFGEYSMEVLHTGKMERFSNEVSILNIFTWTGIFGVVLYFYVFYRASYLAVNRSNNIFIKVIGVCVAFRWLYAWVEDFSQFDLSYIFLWLMISMCYSKNFRLMDDLQMRLWIRGIFYRSQQHLGKNRTNVSSRLTKEIVH